METEKSYTLTTQELNKIIDYIRLEARVSYKLQQILWLTKEKNEIMKSILPIAEKLKFAKQDLKQFGNKVKELILKDSDIITNPSQNMSGVRLKPEDNKEIPNCPK